MGGGLMIHFGRRWQFRDVLINIFRDKTSSRGWEISNGDDNFKEVPEISGRLNISDEIAFFA